MDAIVWIAGLVCLLIGSLIGYLLRYTYGKMKLTSAEQKAVRISKEAVRDAEIRKNEIIISGREEIQKERLELDREVRSSRLELQNIEKRLQAKEENLEKKNADLEIYKQTLSDKENSLNVKLSEVDSQKAELDREKERVAGCTKEQAKEELIALIEDEAKKDAYTYVKKIEYEAALEADRKARDIILESMQRLASETASGIRAVSTVSLPSDEMKGRIIGREGRNIRSIETLTGADIVIDDTPDAVVVSCFDPVRREIAKRTLETLVSDGRIHPARIEDVVNKVTKEVKKIQLEKGEEVAMELGFSSMSTGLIRALGRLHFRYSYSQNVLLHSKECAYLAGMIASELGANAEIAKRAALLHDIGKGAPTESEKGHAEYGARLAHDLGECDEVVNAIASHHDEVPAKTIEALIVKIADKISASRTGARNDSEENYINRLENLENIALSIDGVEKAFAIQAGRELRVIVSPEKVTDEEAHDLAKRITDRIKAELKYPGKIKVTLTRERRFVEYAG